MLWRPSASCTLPLRRWRFSPWNGLGEMPPFSAVARRHSSIVIYFCWLKAGAIQSPKRSSNLPCFQAHVFSSCLNFPFFFTISPMAFSSGSTVAFSNFFTTAFKITRASGSLTSTSGSRVVVAIMPAARSTWAMASLRWLGEIQTGGNLS